MSIDDEFRDTLAQVASHRIQHILEEKEDWENLITVLGKTVMEAKSAKKPTSAEIDSLKYTLKTSSKGDYRLITKTENNDNSAFEKLQTYLKQKGGFSNIHGFKTWIFSNDPEKIGMRSVIGW